ncbi:hypothetical protein RHGRI_002001 [Rhododendron griersonianum]|uniref:Uncharacterized protein n=1 Tax=Rhododendron griersonianum TaxID=479676 RepID=A0AAV6LQA1_9ERIC|nr:hypothetical protein RHGRI_002001 [Rhododendron griersonianum]
MLQASDHLDPLGFSLRQQTSFCLPSPSHQGKALNHVWTIDCKKQKRFLTSKILLTLWSETSSPVKMTIRLDFCLWMPHPVEIDAETAATRAKNLPPAVRFEATDTNGWIPPPHHPIRRSAFLAQDDKEGILSIAAMEKLSEGIDNIKTDDEYLSGDTSILESSIKKTCCRQLFMPESSTIAMNDDDLLLAIAFVKKKND